MRKAGFQKSYRTGLGVAVSTSLAIALVTATSASSATVVDVVDVQNAVLTGATTVGTVTVDGVRKAGEYTGADSGVRAVDWQNTHHARRATDGTEWKDINGSESNPIGTRETDLYWEINDNGGSYSLGMSFEIPTFYRRMIWDAGCEVSGAKDYVGTGSYSASGGCATDSNGDLVTAPEVLGAYHLGSHHNKTKLDYKTQTESEFWRVHGGDLATSKIDWQKGSDLLGSYQYATSHDFLIGTGLCTTVECFAFDTPFSVELRKSYGDRSSAFAAMSAISKFTLHMSDEAWGLDNVRPPVEPPSTVPLPASLPLLGFGVFGLFGLRARRKQK